MIIVTRRGVTEAEIDQIREKIESPGPSDPHLPR